MAGIPDSPENGYFQVKNAKIEHNTFVGCKTPFVFGYAGDKKATLMPENTLVPGNRFTNMKPKDTPDHPGLLWHQRDLQKPAWVDQREAAGPSWKL